ncbi:rhombotarget A [Acinetobacter sp. CFCC 10889]|uniref:rhombotarget A n=1 Tax=Acinetobacter sp. CFCC 10889 TaxID=1775557 RepID=UPI000DCF8050|nr:rhombotarget A [Acinetobacter sp. CFCC 10889]
MLKRGIGLGLLCISGHAFSANITVTTTEDVVKADDQCSLREAIEYVNKGMPEAGLNGCGGKESNAIIELKGKQEYLLKSQISIAQSVDIKSVYDTTVTDTASQVGLSNAIIKASGNHRLFNIKKVALATDKTEVEKKAKISVNLSELTLQGCGASRCETQGGLIYNNEILSITDSRLLNGTASQGGAIYNAGVPGIDFNWSVVSIEKSLIKGNKAAQGGVVYSEAPQFVIAQSVVRDNEVTDSSSSLFEAKAPFSAEVSKNLSASTLTRGIFSSTIFNNKGYIIKVLDDMQVINATMILNSMGLVVNAPNKKGYVANSILAKNGSQDCKIVAGGEANQISNNLYSVGCGGTGAQALGNTTLIAGKTTEGKCDLSSTGILCPYNPLGESVISFFKPRLIESYKTIADSPIVNKGPQNSDVLACVMDQRSTKRPDNGKLCDRGAIELSVDTSTNTTVGEDISYGGVAKFSLSANIENGSSAKFDLPDQLQDGELVTPAQCTALFGKPTDGSTWKPGCLKIVQTNTPSKGKLTITQDGDITYVPNGNWHGSDEFQLKVITSTTYFSDNTEPYIAINARVVQAPVNTFEDKKVKTSGGGVGVIALFTLFGLIGLRRTKK